MPTMCSSPNWVMNLFHLDYYLFKTQVTIFIHLIFSRYFFSFYRGVPLSVTLLHGFYYTLDIPSKFSSCTDKPHC